MEKFEQTTSQEKEQAIEQLKELFQIKIGAETTEYQLKKSLIYNDFRKATIAITSTFDIYLSDQEHLVLLQDNGLDSRDVYEAYLTKMGEGGSWSMDSLGGNSRRFRSLFVTPENEGMWKKFGEDMFVELLQETIEQKITDYVEKLLAEKE